MSEISKERAQEIFLGSGPEPTAQEERALARIALDWLALRERAEPVGFVGRNKETGKFASWLYPEAPWLTGDKYEVLSAYITPPAPVVHAETFDEWSRRCEIQLTLCRPEFREVAEITWKACRDAMLAAPGKQPLSVDVLAGALRNAPLAPSDNQGRQRAPVEPEWTNQQCLEFLSIAFRHAEIKGDFELDDLRLGVKMANAMTTGKEG